MSRLLVVDDDPTGLELLRSVLAKEGYAVSAASSAEEALQKLRGTLPDLVILDLGLPGLSGLSLCALLKKEARTAAIPVIILSQEKRESMVVGGLNSGADDYMTKPFRGRELVARVEAVLRRGRDAPAAGRVLQACGIRMDLDQHAVWALGKPLGLRPKEFALLEVLLRRKGHALTHAFLAEEVWGTGREATSQDVKWWIHQLREKLGKLGAKIETVPQIGYRLADE